MVRDQTSDDKTTQSPDELEVHVIASGRVQGVNFRYNVLTRALKLKLKGYVRNLSDGTVEILAQGPRGELEQLVEFVSNSPGYSIVTDVKVNWRKPTKTFDSFNIRF